MRKAKKVLHPKVPCPRCGKQVGGPSAMGHHQQGRGCGRSWFAQLKGIDERALPPVHWSGLVSACIPVVLQQSILDRCLTDQPFADTIEATWRLTGSAARVLDLVETAEERRARRMREEAQRREREARSTLKYLLKERKRLQQQIKDATRQVAYYDRKHKKEA